MRKRLLLIWLGILAAFYFNTGTAQSVDPGAIKSMVERFKIDARGPYRDIRWFCDDGTIREARDPCPDDTGNQHARLKDEVKALGDNSHIYLGQILASTKFPAFWDELKAQSRLKQYQVELYLRNVDNGWINRKAQFYRGAMQTEDESLWGEDFFKWLLEDGENIKSKYFLIRQSAKDIPHAGDNNNAQLVRALSEEIAEKMTSFQDLRIKIHGTPDENDPRLVTEFREKNKEKISAETAPLFDQLIGELNIMYRPLRIGDFKNYLDQLPKQSEAASALAFFIERYPTMDCPPEQCRFISSTALQLRRQITTPMSSRARLALLDVSNKMEALLGREFTHWKPEYLTDLLQQVYTLSEAATAFGFLELWEWDQVEKQLAVPATGTITLSQLNDYSEGGRNVAEWGAGMVRAHYAAVVNQFSEFEPLSEGFYDDRVRSSILLHLGRTVSWLGDEFAHKAGFSNEVLKISNQSSIHGLNPGFTVGELVVVSGSPEKIDLSPDKIYVFNHPPSDLKPVAGIATVTEGNTVSHIQLLARNLGIPNAVVSEANMEAMEKFSGKKVFYAVSKKGTVIMKLAEEMDQEENKLFEKKQRSEEKITVPVSRIELHNPHILNLNTIDATNSGKTCGPKAANLGQLKKMFPDNVVEGLVVPFSVFRQHMNQPIPGQNTNYWAMMIGIFDAGECLRCSGVSDAEVETFILKRLDTLRSFIKEMPFLPSFKFEMEQQFQSVFGQPLGKVPVFVRSDTNMEDLKDFTGAGLNLTVFNVVDPEKIYQGIRDVWASPYSERSFRWRQRYLNNPENVFPSIVIIPSVNGDYSGVMITKGIASNTEGDLTVAFNRGVGGAVDGQAAESWLLAADKTEHLISPAREATYLTIPATGGSVRVNTSFEKRILTTDNFVALRSLADRIQVELPKAPGITTKGPFDMELGFKDNKIWLFQVRPFVENKQAAASDYLERITPTYDTKRILNL